MLFAEVRLFNSSFLRYSSTSVKFKLKLDEGVQRDIENCAYKPRKHPGNIIPKTVTIPDVIISGSLMVLQDYPVKTILGKSKSLVQHLKNRQPPLEEHEKHEVTANAQQKIEAQLSKHNCDNPSLLKNAIQTKTTSLLYKTVYNWRPIDYDIETSLMYLLGRFAPEYTILYKIFSEINTRDPKFVPRSYFDFGSGVGTGLWAASAFWKKDIFEYFNVDASRDMNDVAELLLKEGCGTKKTLLKGVSFRQFLPATKIPYDLVVCAYSLFELPSAKTRLEILFNLWSRTQKYLVLVEQGTNHGFRMLNEARDYLLQLENHRGHVFSPCPHDFVCPRHLEAEKTPCNFQTKYMSLPIGQPSKSQSERFCYVVLKKGDRDDTDPRWPRVVRETLVRSRHAVCRMCTSAGTLEEVIFTPAKHGKIAHHCARSTLWGNLLPFNKDDNEDERNKSDVNE